MGKLPKSYKDISVKKYQEIAPLLEGINDLTGIDYLERWGKIADSLGMDDITFEQIKQLAFLTRNDYVFLYKYLWVSGRLYKATNNVDDANSGQILSIKTFLSQGDVISQLHNIAACTYKKLTLKGWVVDKNHNKLAEALQKKSCHKILPVVFFCSNVLKSVMTNSVVYSEAMKTIQERMKEIHRIISEGNFTITGDGLQQ